MLPKQHRFSLRKEFNRIKKEGRLFRGEFFSLLAAGGQLSEPRFAFIVSKKVNKLAVKRNKVRRILAEAVQIFLPKIKLSVDAVFLVKKTIIDKSFGQIKKEVERIFKQADLLK